MLGKLFTTADGKIPFLQIAIGIMIGALAMFIYAKFYKPKILFQDTYPSLRSPTKIPPQIDTNAQEQSHAHAHLQVQSAPKQSVGRVPGHPTFLDMNDISPSEQVKMPKLPQIYKQDEYSNEEEEKEDDDDEEQEPNDIRLLQ
jgi:hypothetical protein